MGQDAAKLEKIALGKRIAEARKLSKGPDGKSYTQGQVAFELGVTVQAVSGWERGQSEPTRSNLVDLARFLDKSLLWLVEGDKSPFAEAEKSYLEVRVEDREMALEQAKKVLERWVK